MVEKLATLSSSSEVASSILVKGQVKAFVTQDAGEDSR
jgi:hypothetical protein